MAAARPALAATGPAPADRASGPPRRRGHRVPRLAALGGVPAGALRGPAAAGGLRGSAATPSSTGLGDWVFSGVLYDDPGWGAARIRDYAADRGVFIGTALAMRPYAAPFIDACAAEVLAAEPDVVGFTSTFMQNVPPRAGLRTEAEDARI
ncbi:hypothetical protein LT493_30005 [Streptomyces tricolor]|nr:hypothetical protein [Streptomyces tricolor]